MYGVDLGGKNNSLSNATVANNGSYGLYINGSPNNTLLNITSTNNGTGIYIPAYSTDNSLLNIAAANNQSVGIDLGAGGNSGNYFTGLLKVGGNTTNDCSDSSKTSFSDASCTAVAPSDFTLSSNVTLAASFVGKVTSDDTANSGDTAGTATYPAVPGTFDWLNFDNSYRGWGIDGSAFPAADNQGQWTTGTGRIWDWSLANGDTGDAGSPVIQNVLTAQLTGNAANSIEHAWVGVAADQAACTVLTPGSVWNATDDCRSTYLRNATEIAGDNIGNDNGLCENGETCLYTPNIGAYQGHGTLVSAGTFTDGDTLTGITLMKYQTNGY